jgi:hypothetical protein
MHPPGSRKQANAPGVRALRLGCTAAPTATGERREVLHPEQIERKHECTHAGPPFSEAVKLLIQDPQIASRPFNPPMVRSPMTLLAGTSSLLGTGLVAILGVSAPPSERGPTSPTRSCARRGHPARDPVSPEPLRQPGRTPRHGLGATDQDPEITHLDGRSPDPNLIHPALKGAHRAPPMTRRREASNEPLRSLMREITADLSVRSPTTWSSRDLAEAPPAKCR